MEANLDEVAQMLASADTLWSYYAFINSALIILREGLEVALILPTILTMLRVMGATRAIHYIHLGWILALIAGALTWIATRTVLTLSGQHRESMEGFITVFAAVVLFYVGFWLHTRAAAKKWQAFIRERVQNVVSTKSIFALVGISFFAVYREAFEVVLFYQALWLQNESNHGAMIWGFLAGLAALVVVIFAILKLGLHLPLKYFFQRYRDSSLHYGFYFRRQRNQGIASRALVAQHSAQFSAAGATLGNLSHFGNAGGSSCDAYCIRRNHILVGNETSAGRVRI
jgi:high-affinity iron transporter